MSQIQLTDEQKDYLSMLDGLVMSIVGVGILDLPEKERENIVEECLDYFARWIEDYVERKYSKKDAMRVKAARMASNDTDVFSKYEDLGPKFDEAWSAFFTEREKEWQKKIQNGADT